MREATPLVSSSTFWFSSFLYFLARPRAGELFLPGSLHDGFNLLETSLFCTLALPYIFNLSLFRLVSSFVCMIIAGGLSPWPRPLPLLVTAMLPYEETPQTTNIQL